MPSALSQSTMDFYIKGKAVYDSSQNIALTKITQVNAQSETRGTFSFTFEPTYYELTLYAVSNGQSSVTSSNVESIALAKASAAVDLRTNDEINFNLSSYHLSGSGEFSLSIYADGWPCDTSEYNIIFGLYDRSTGSALFKTEYSTTSSQTVLPSALASAVTFSSSGSEVAAGTYLLKITFENPTGSTYCYTEDTVILANQTTRGTVAIPDIIGTSPTAPTFLVAGFCDNSGTSFMNLSYFVEFLWDDTSYNETDFEIELMDITALCDWNSDSQINSYYNDAPTTYSTSTALYAPVPKILDSFTAAGVLSASQGDMDDWWKLCLNLFGSNTYGVNLGVNSQVYVRSKFYESNLTDDNWTTNQNCYALINLSYGNTYLARIRAINDAGSSEWVYLDLPNRIGKSFIATSSLSASSFSSFDSDASGISRYRIFYQNDGGSYYNYDSNEASYTNVNSSVISEYPLVLSCSQKRNSFVSIVNPINLSYAGASSTASLYYYDSDYSIWQNWSSESSSSTAFYDSLAATYFSYSGCRTLNLYAYYGTDTTAKTFSLRNTTDPLAPEDSDICVTAHIVNSSIRSPFSTDTEDHNSANYAPISLSEGSVITISKSSYGYITFLLNTTNTGADSVKFTIVKSGSQGTTYTEGGGSYSVTSITHQNKVFKFCQIDLLDYDTDTVYNVFYTFLIDGSEYHYTLTFMLTS